MSRISLGAFPANTCKQAELNDYEHMGKGEYSR